MSEKSKFVLIGVLAWGVSLFLLSEGWGLLVDRVSRPQATSHFILWTLIHLLFFLLAGAIIGLGAWSVRKRQKAEDQKAS